LDLFGKREETDRRTGIELKTLFTKTLRAYLVTIFLLELIERIVLLEEKLSNTIYRIKWN
jgi:hypothetical protein